MKTSELIGAALDWAVAKCEGDFVESPNQTEEENLSRYFEHYGHVSYSTFWAEGGPLLEKYRIRIDCPWNPGPFEATCKIDGTTAWVKGPTILIAAARCIVYAELGDEIEVPEALA